MITDALTRRGNPATTSDRWHVVHATWCGSTGTAPFARKVVSEHSDRTAAVTAAKKLAAKIDPIRAERPAAQRDQILVRPPRFRSLKFSTHRAKKRHR